MAKFVPVSREKHASKAWRRPNGYSYAAMDAVAPIGGSEFSLAAPAMPIAFVKQEGRYVPVAVMGLKAGVNVFIGPAGQWLGNYIPAVLRTYPFCLVNNPGAEQATLCVDEESSLIVDPDQNTEKFFENDGSPSAASKVILEFLRRTAHDRALADLATASLVEAGVIQPWPLTVPIGNQQIRVEGLHRVDEAALNALGDEAFCKLRKGSALVAAYGQMLSTGQVSVLARLTGIQQRMADIGQSLGQTLTPPLSSM
jgi:hypothetical protein